MIAEHDRQTRHALAANQPDFDLLAVGLNGDNGCESRFGENKRRRFACWVFRETFASQGSRI